MVRLWQKSIASYSCQYISLHDSNAALLARHLKQTDDDNREVLPCFFVMQQIISHLKKHQVGVQLIIRNPFDTTATPLELFFEVLNHTFIQSDNVNFKKPYFTAHCVSCALTSLADMPLRHDLQRRILGCGVEKILLASVANHPQYSGRKLSELNKANPYQTCSLILKQEKLEVFQPLLDLSKNYSSSMGFAIRTGCDYEEPTFIFVEHMFAARPMTESCIPNFSN